MAPEPSSAVAARLCEVGRSFYARGWVLGTSGNFSIVTSRDPLTLAVTPSGAHKGRLAPADILSCDEQGAVISEGAPAPVTLGPRNASVRPSAETLLHIEIARRRRAGAVLHTHSVWSTMLSDVHAAAGGLSIEGFEMLKGLQGVSTHEHAEWIPILENDQDMARLAQRAGEMLDGQPGAHAFLLRRHGLYTWGETLEEAERHVEILEFLFETVGRRERSYERTSRV